MQQLRQDVRFDLCTVAKNHGFTAVAMMTLVLGIGANGTVFIWINSTLLHPIPGQAHSSDLVSVMRGERSEYPSPPFSYMYPNSSFYKDREATYVPRRSDHLN